MECSNSKENKEQSGLVVPAGTIVVDRVSKVAHKALMVMVDRVSKVAHLVMAASCNC